MANIPPQLGLDSTNNIGLMFLAEQVSPENNFVKNLSCGQVAGTQFAEFHTILQSFDSLNRNNRRYYGPNIAEMLKAERILTMLKTNAWYGEMDHPYENINGQKLTPERLQTIEMSRRSHKILNPEVKGNLMYATIQTASGTEWGRGMCSEILQGLIPSFSCRAIAGIQDVNGKPYVIVRKLITYDWVLYPSHKEANMDSTPKFVTKTSTNFTATESVSNSNNNNCYTDIRSKYTQDIKIALKDIFDYITDKDENTKAIMESFDLKKEDLIGFDKSKQHAIIRDRNNLIYANISARTKNEVTDFLSSF